MQAYLQCFILLKLLYGGLGEQAGAQGLFRQHLSQGIIVLHLDPQIPLITSLPPPLPSTLRITMQLKGQRGWLLGVYESPKMAAGLQE